jgi:ATP-dependent exoDNAse (exonuclease V) alpha subunit
MLAPDQEQAVREISSWWTSGKAYHILDGGAGTGKTFVVDTILETLPRAVPILLAPTHKAVRQLKAKTKGDYEFRTVASALGIRPVDEGKELRFEQIQLPSIWDSVNIAVVDEVSMLPEYQLDLLRRIGTKILYVGHSSQLPPVALSRSMFDKCISPVFEQGYGVSNLYIPKRNTGKLWDYCNMLEQKIYDDSIKTPMGYDVSARDFKDSITAKLESFHEGDSKIALWTNEGVYKYNTRIRELIHGRDKLPKYLKDDLIITTNTGISFDGMEFLKDKDILRHANQGLDIYTDTDGKLLSVCRVTITLNKNLAVQAYKLRVRTDIEGVITLYELCDSREYTRIADYYEHIAWEKHDKKSRDKAYAERATILKCFFQIKHFYASTAHRLQGSSIKNVITIASDIGKNSNRVEKNKLMYVACSRASETLSVYRGL